jgi:hypothetical protein
LSPIHHSFACNARLTVVSSHGATVESTEFRFGSMPLKN